MTIEAIRISKGSAERLGVRGDERVCVMYGRGPLLEEASFEGVADVDTWSRALRAPAINGRPEREEEKPRSLPDKSGGTVVGPGWALVPRHRRLSEAAGRRRGP